MSKNEKNIIEKFISLEKWLFEISLNGLTITELENILAGEDFSLEEQNYLITAHNLPFSDMVIQIENHDNNKSDEQTFINDLKTKYNLDASIIIRRIIEVREIQKYLSQNPNLSFPSITVYDQLVRDKIPDVITSNGDIAIYRALNNKEYLHYLLKKDSEQLEKLQNAQSFKEIEEILCDKLELIKTMANYYGFNFEKVVDTNNLRNKEKGSFSQKLVLEKVIEQNKC